MPAFAKGKRHCLKVTTPLVDIWSRVWKQVDGLKLRNVVLQSIPSYQTANSEESWEEMFDRRGNEVADLWAAEGRKMHDLPKHITVALKKAETTTMEYHTWTAHAAFP